MKSSFARRNGAETLVLLYAKCDVWGLKVYDLSLYLMRKLVQNGRKEKCVILQHFLAFPSCAQTKGEKPRKCRIGENARIYGYIQTRQEATAE